MCSRGLSRLGVCSVGPGCCTRISARLNRDPCLAERNQTESVPRSRFHGGGNCGEHSSGSLSQCPAPVSRPWYLAAISLHCCESGPGAATMTASRQNMSSSIDSWMSARAR